MALKKKITTENGIPVEYHRVSTVCVNVNCECVVVVYGYADGGIRAMELEDDGEERYPMHVHEDVLSIPYSDDLNVSKAYEWLKTLPRYEGAEDA